MTTLPQTTTATLSPETCGCFDFWCTCGESVHLCDHSPGQDWSCTCGLRWWFSDEVLLTRVEGVPHSTHISCGYGEFGENVPYVERDLTPTNFDPLMYREFGRGEAGSYQWKGTASHLTYTCLCGVKCHHEGEWFVYHSMCWSCAAAYAVDPNVKAEVAP